MKRYRQRALEQYEKILAATQSASGKESRLLRRVYARNWLPVLPVDKESAFLDLGCGFGTFLDFLAAEGYTDIQGVDLCEANVEICKRKGHEVTQADLTQFLEGCEERFDVVTLSYVLEHFEKDDGLGLLEGARGVLKPGGVLLIAVPNAAAPLVGTRQRYSDITHEVAFTQESLVSFLQMAGFESFEIRPIDIFVLPNPLLDIPARIMAWFLFKAFRIIFLLYGVPGTTIFTKNMLAIARKEV